MQRLNGKCQACVVCLYGGFVGPCKLLVYGGPYLCRVLGPVDGVLGATVIRRSPVEVELLEAVDP